MQSTIPAKQQLRQALLDFDGDPSHPEVAKAIAELVSHQPTRSQAENLELLQGNWLLINAPNFPDRLPDEQNRSVYHLGRLAFNAFQPLKLKIAIERIVQPIFLTDKPQEYTHHIEVEFKIVEPNLPELEGVIKNLAICHPVSDDAVQVQFTGGELKPRASSSSETLAEWLKIFNSKQRSKSWRDLASSGLLKLMFGLTKPTSLDPQTGKTSFVMKRSPKGVLKIVYLDEELRITQGRKESIMVCERLPTNKI